MNRTNCPNCGAPLNRNHECDYCGTIVHGQCTSFSKLSLTASGISIVVGSTSDCIDSANAVCPVCGGRFIKFNEHQKYCSIKCERGFKQVIAIRDEKGRLHRREVDLR